MAQDQSAGSDSTCPVDHKSRQAWLDKARAAPHPSPPTAATAADAASCPVDHTSRQAWLSKTSSSSSVPPGPSTRQATHFSLDASRYQPLPPAIPTARPPRSLDRTRTISTIPRSATSPSGPGHDHAPANSESESGRSDTGNWVYPSEQQFFDALRRKALPASERDMASVVPIHNAVNERTWAEILAWERGRWPAGPGAESRLVSFAGDAGKRSPRAWWNENFRGYKRPFDRHDWVVERGGREVEYVIDYYEGRGGAGMLNFYLDVRPKVNSLEGVGMRVRRAMGW